MSLFAPYPGLRPFHRDEAHIFFGREEQTDELLRRLNATHFLAIVGPSGCGKSSLARAGMIAALETGFMASAGSRWRFAVMRPGSHPMRRLATALIEEASLVPEGVDKTDVLGFLSATLWRGPLGLVEALAETPLPSDTNLLILVDQFEEIFRFRREGGQDEADAFVALLLESAQQREASVYIVITMRSDFFGDCAVFTGLPEALNKSQYLTPRLTREQQRAAIVGPARVFDGDIEPELINRLLNEMGPHPDQLPLLQHLLMRMWTWEGAAHRGGVAPPPCSEAAVEAAEEMFGRVLTLRDYEEVGGLKQALSNHADEAFDHLDQRQQKIAEIMFRRLSERGADLRDTRRPTRISEIAALAETSFEEVTRIVDIFRAPDCSFLVPACPEPLYPETVLDISHESLIRQWDRLRQWAAQEAQSAEEYRFLEQTARLWKQKHAALWGTPNLETALEWRNNERPTTVWAKRYGGEFELAMEFLDASEKADLAQKAAEETKRQQELEQARLLVDMEQKRADAERERAELQIQTNKRLRHLVWASCIASMVILSLAVLWWMQLETAKKNLDRALVATDTMVRLFYDPFDNLIDFPTNAIGSKLPKINEAIDRLGQAYSSTDINLRLLNTRASLLNLYSDLYRRQGKTSQALARAQDAASIIEETGNHLEKLDNSDSVKQEGYDNLAESYNRIAVYQSELSNESGALESTQKAIGYLEKLIVIDPDKEEWQQDIFMNYANIVYYYAAMDERDKAKQFAEQASNIAEHTIKLNPDSLKNKHILADKFQLDAMIEEKNNGNDKSKVWLLYRKVIELREQAVNEDQYNQENRYQFADSLITYSVSLQSGEDKEHEEASTAFQRALKEMDALTQRDPDNMIWQEKLAEVHGYLAEYSRFNNNPKESLSHYEKAWEIQNRLVDLEPNHLNRKWKLANLESSFGDVLQDLKEGKKAREHYEKSITLSKELVQTDQKNSLIHVIYIIDKQIKLGNLLGDLGEHETALQAFYDARSLTEKYIEPSPKDIDWLGKLVDIHSDIDSIEEARGNLENALQSFQSKIALLNSLIKKEAANPRWHSKLADSYRRIAKLHESREDNEAALNAYQQAVTAQKRVVELKPEDDEGKHDLCRHYAGFVSALLIKQNNYDKALAVARERFEVTKTALTLKQNDSSWQYDYAVSHFLIALSLEALKKSDEAAIAYNDSAETLENLLQAESDNLGWRRDLATVYGKIATLWESQKERQRAFSYRRKAIDVWQAVVDRATFSEPQFREIINKAEESSYVEMLVKIYKSKTLREEVSGNVDWQHELALAHENFSNMLLNAGDITSAIQEQRESVAVLERAVAWNSKSIGKRAELSSAYNQLGNLLERTDDWDNALAAYHRQLQQIQYLAETDPVRQDQKTSITIIQWTANAYSRIANVLAWKQDFQESYKVQKEAVANLHNLVTQQPDDADRQVELVAAYRNLAYLASLQNDSDGERQAREESTKVLESLRKLKQSDGEVQVVINEILPDSQAVKLELKKGDAIMRYAGREVPNVLTMVRWVREEGEGPRELVILRDGNILSFSVKPGRLGVDIGNDFIPVSPR